MKSCLFQYEGSTWEEWALKEAPHSASAITYNSLSCSIIHFCGLQAYPPFLLKFSVIYWATQASESTQCQGIHTIPRNTPAPDAGSETFHCCNFFFYWSLQSHTILYLLSCSEIFLFISPNITPYIRIFSILVRSSSGRSMIHKPRSRVVFQWWILLIALLSLEVFRILSNHVYQFKYLEILMKGEGSRRMMTLAYDLQTTRFQRSHCLKSIALRSVFPLRCGVEIHSWQSCYDCRGLALYYTYLFANTKDYCCK